MRATTCTSAIAATAIILAAAACAPDPVGPSEPRSAVHAALTAAYSPAATSVLHPSRLMGDDWTGYANNSAFKAAIGAGKLYGKGRNQTLVRIDTAVRYRGHQTLRYALPAGSNAAPQLWPSIPNGKKLGNVWLHAVVRYSAGFTTAGTSSGPEEYRLFGLGYGNTSGRSLLEVVNGTEYRLSARTSNNSMLPATASAGAITTEWTDRAWYHYFVHYELLSPSLTRTRVFLARGNQTPVLLASIQNSVAAGFPAPKVGAVMLGLHFDQVRPKQQLLWLGMWEVVNGSQHPNPFAIPGA